MKAIHLFPIIFLLVLACNSSKMTYSWKMNQTVSHDFKKIMVVALDNHPERSDVKASMEEHLVEDLKSKGYEAVSAMREIGPKSFVGVSEKQALEQLQNKGADAVLTIVLLDKKRERYYVPGRVQYSPYIIYQRRFWGYYSTIYDRIYTPGYYMDDTRYFWESSLYDLKTKELVYTAQTESFDPASATQMAHEYGLLIVSDLMHSNVLKAVTPISKN
jgi:hypothetical protein